VAFTYNNYNPYCLLVFVWTLSNNSLRTYSGHPFHIIGLAISDNGGSDDHWLAASSDAIVSVWDITTGEHKTLIDISNIESMEISEMAFAGPRLEVLYWSFWDQDSGRYDFSLLDIRTREQLYTVPISFCIVYLSGTQMGIFAIPRLMLSIQSTLSLGTEVLFIPSRGISLFTLS
jgi:WD40 repeat protein